LDALDRWLALAPLLLGAAFAAACVWIVAKRIGYPFELEWMEGGTLHHIQRVLAGLPLYAKPSAEFIAYGYTPLYVYLSALVAKWIGLGFLAPRLVSAASGAACFALIWLLTRRRSDSWETPVLAVFFFAAAFHLTGAWLDIARVDTLFLALLLAAIAAFESPRPAVRSLVSPALFFLAFFAKQTALMLGAPLAVLAFFLRRGPERFLFGAVLAALVAGSTALFDRATSDWYSYYVFELPGDHGIIMQFDVLIGAFWVRDLLEHVAIALCFCMVPFLERISAHEWNGESRDRFWTDAFVAGGLLVMSWSGRSQLGGWNNALLPVFAGLAIFFAVGVERARALLGDSSAYRIGVSLAATLQLAAFAYRPGLEVPTATDRSTALALVDRIAATRGDVYLADHPWYKVMAGKPPQAQAQAVIDILRAHSPERSSELLAELRESLGSGRYELLICDIEGCANGVNVSEWYELSPEKPTASELVPVTGGANRKPTYLYRRRAAPTAD
jgi:hypothetical protein